ncbi:MAG: ABC transporter substrate-binding protein [Desulforudis sp.]|jgi:polar amino acid transport system substrate-binding protein|nr:MAG: ABC transporter substrate-binding protein [Desulforudis sp.]
MLFVLVVGMAFIVTGCGGADTSPEPPAKATFSYAMSGAYPPFSYFDDNDNLLGFDVEIGTALAEKMGLEADPVPTPWQALPLGLNAGRYDAIIGSMTITEARLEKFDFSDPYYRSGPKLFVRADSNIKGVDDLTAESTIAVLMESVYEELAREYTDKLKFYDNDVLALRELAAGRADAVITDQIVGLTNAKELGLDIVSVGDLLMVEEIGIAIRKGETDLLNAVNQALADIKADGTYLAISEKYVGADISGD